MVTKQSTDRVFLQKPSVEARGVIVSFSCLPIRKLPVILLQRVEELVCQVNLSEEFSTEDHNSGW